MNDKLSDAMNEIRDEFILDAAKRKKRRPWLYSAIAAVLVLAIFVVSWGRFVPVKVGAISVAEYPLLGEYDYEDESGKNANRELKAFYERIIGKFLVDNGTNLAYSPVNIYMSLCVLAELSNGNQQIMDLLGASSLEALRIQANTIWNDTYLKMELGECLLANSLWLNDSVSVDRKIMDTLAKNYYTSSYGADFGSEQTSKAIQDWLNENTGNLLQEQVQNIQLSPETVFAEFSTVFFRATWGVGFEEKNHTQGVFHGKQDTTCTFMNTAIPTIYYVSEDYLAVEIPASYGSMLVFLPNEGKTVNDILMSQDYLDFIIRENIAGNEDIHDAAVILSIPKFDIQCNSSLEPGLRELGVTDIFESSKRPFSKFLKGSDICLENMQQATRVSINETGITAASILGCIAGGGGPGELIEFVVDRPFLFVITNKSEVPLFAGIVNDLS